MIIDYPIKKPVAAMSHQRPFINIREDVLLRAIRRGNKIRVWDNVVIDPKKWLKTGKLKLQVFKRPDEPMRLIGNWIFQDKNQSVMFPEKKKMDRAEELARAGNL